MLAIALKTNGNLVTTHSHNNEMKGMDSTLFIIYKQEIDDLFKRMKFKLLFKTDSTSH